MQFFPFFFFVAFNSGGYAKNERKTDWQTNRHGQRERERERERATQRVIETDKPQKCKCQYNQSKWKVNEMNERMNKWTNECLCHTAG